MMLSSFYDTCKINGYIYFVKIVNVLYLINTENQYLCAYHIKNVNKRPLITISSRPQNHSGLNYEYRTHVYKIYDSNIIYLGKLIIHSSKSIRLSVNF